MAARRIKDVVIIDPTWNPKPPEPLPPEPKPNVIVCRPPRMRVLRVHDVVVAGRGRVVEEILVPWGRNPHVLQRDAQATSGIEP